MKALHHVGITVADLDRALDFYHGVLGLELVEIAYEHAEERRAAAREYLEGREAVR